MQDPLSFLPIKYKLPLTFLLLCLVTLTIGGYLVSRFAHDALQHEIDLRLRADAASQAAAIAAARDLLGRRVEDFASDGLIRDLLSRASGSSSAEASAELARHLTSNKTPLVSSFVDCSVFDGDGRRVAGSRDACPAELSAAADRARRHDGLWYGDFVPPGETDPFPAFAIATPVRSLDGRREMGRLVAWVNAGLFIANAPISDRAVRDGQTRLVLRDGAGQDLVVPWWLRAGSSGSDVQRDAVGLVLVSPDEARTSRDSAAVHAHTCHLGGWSVRVEMDAHAAMAPIRALQSRYLGAGLATIGIGLAAMLLSVRFLVVPLGRLRDAARRLMKGDLEARVTVESDDEIADVGRSFNAMAGAIETRAMELERKHDELRAVVSSMQDGLCLLDAEGEVVLANDSAGPLLAALRAPDRHLSPRRGCHEPFRANCAECLAEAGRRTCEMEIGDRVYEVVTSDLQAGAAIAGRLLVARDVTERLAMAEREAFHERMAVVGEVASVVAHEINNPLTSISMFNQMMSDELAADSPHREHVEVIDRNTRACKRAIRDLLDNVRGGTTEVHELDLRDVVDDAVRFLRPVARRSGVTLDAQVCERPAATVGDEVTLRQVLVNLALNAIQSAREAGGGTVVLRAEGGEETVRVDVVDDGPGIPEKLRERVFDPFFTTKGPGDGTGLGLPTARRTVAAHGGRLTLEVSRPGETRFRVELPTPGNHPNRTESHRVVSEEA